MRLKAATTAKPKASDLIQRTQYATYEIAKRENVQLAEVWPTMKTIVRYHTCIQGANAYAASVRVQTTTNGIATTQMHKI